VWVEYESKRQIQITNQLLSKPGREELITKRDKELLQTIVKVCEHKRGLVQHNVYYFCNMHNYADKLQGRVFKTIAQASRVANLRTYVIGGYVRDLIIGRPSKDVDFVVVGSGQWG